MRPKRTAPSPLSTEPIWADVRSTSTKHGRKAKAVGVAAVALAAVSVVKAAEAGVGVDPSGASPAGNLSLATKRGRPYMTGRISGAESYGYAVGNQV